MSVSFDTILANLEKTIEIDHGYESVGDMKNALLEYMGATIPDVKTGIEYKKAPEKPTVDGNTLYGYCAWWYDSSGDFYQDSYGDLTIPGSWQDHIQTLEQEKHNTGKSHLLPHLLNHSKDKQIGACMKLVENSKGVYYESRLSDTDDARKVKSLASDGFLGASYGYEPLVTQETIHKGKRARKLVKIAVREISATAFPAVPYTSANVKSLYTGKITPEYLLSLQMRYYEYLLDGLLRSR